MTADPGVALATERLAKKYGSQVALDGLDLRVPTGVVYGFLGPNGAGKTTTMRILTGLIRPDSGRVELLGRPFGRGDRKRLFEVGALIESPSFYPFLSGRENLRALAATGAPVTRARIDEVLELVNLGERGRDKVSGYSLGMKQRLGIAAALLNDPKLLLLDEPANGLDPAGIVGMRDSLRALAASGKTVFVSSHILSEVQQLADVVGIIGHGRLIREGSVETLLREEGSIRIRVAPAEVPTAAELLTRIAGRRHGDPRGRPGRRLAERQGRPRPIGGAEPRAGGRGRVRVADRGRLQPRIAVPGADRVASRRRRRPGRPGGRTGRAAHGVGQRPRHQARADRVEAMRLLRRQPPQARPAARDLGDVPAPRRARRADVPRADRQLAASARTRRRSSRRSWS